MRTVDLTEDEWRSLGRLPTEIAHGNVPDSHRQKLIRLGVATEKTGRLITTFEGRLMLRERGLTKT